MRLCFVDISNQPEQAFILKDGTNKTLIVGPSWSDDFIYKKEWNSDGTYTYVLYENWHPTLGWEYHDNWIDQFDDEEEIEWQPIKLHEIVFKRTQNKMKIVSEWKSERYHELFQ